MDVSDVRRRVRGAIERARRDASARRERSDVAARDYDQFLEERAVPIVRMLANALVAEGHRFTVFTPAGSVRLSSERSGEDYIELTLDTTADPPQVVGRVNRGRGRGSITSERAVREGTPVRALSEEDVVEFVLAEIGGFLDR